MRDSELKMSDIRELNKIMQIMQEYDPNGTWNIAVMDIVNERVTVSNFADSIASVLADWIDNSVDAVETRELYSLIDRIDYFKENAISELVKRIADYIIKDVMDSTTNFQGICFYEDIQEQFAKEIEQQIYDLVEHELSTREEVADVVQDTDGFDVVFYTDFVEGYEEEEEEGGD